MRTSLSSYRWQPDRVLTDKEKAIYWESKCRSLRAENEVLMSKIDRCKGRIAALDEANAKLAVHSSYLDSQNQRLSLHIARYNRVLASFPQATTLLRERA